MAFILSIFTAFSLYFGTAGSQDYIRQTGLDTFCQSIICKDEILCSEYTGIVSDEQWNPSQEYSLEDTAI